MMPIRVCPSASRWRVASTPPAQLSAWTEKSSFDGEHWHGLGVELDAKVLSDDYVNQRYGGFFTGAFVGLAAVDLSGYDAEVQFVDFDYRELTD